MNITRFGFACLLCLLLAVNTAAAASTKWQSTPSSNFWLATDDSNQKESCLKVCEKEAVACEGKWRVDPNKTDDENQESMMEWIGDICMPAHEACKQKC